MSARWKRKLDCLFRTIDELTQRAGNNSFQGDVFTELSHRPDLVTAGLPCQAFTEFRTNKRRTAPHRHPKFDIVFDRFFRHIKKVKPRGGVCEEVGDFARELSIAEFGPEWKEQIPRSWLRHFEKKLHDEGYATKVSEFDFSRWRDVPRVRLL